MAVMDEGGSSVVGGGRWSGLRLAAFRFVFAFVGLYTVDVIAGFVQRQARLMNGDYPTPFPEPFTAPLWHAVVPWVGIHVLHLAHPVATSYEVGGDSVYEYILRGTELVIALVAAVVWTLLDRRRKDYRELDAWLRIFVRAGLAVEMLFYGLGKVPPAQFGVLSLYRQAQPLGQLWPMAMLWAFMAASPGYTLLCGLVETMGGLLLLWRRTVGIGALISAGAMANVLVLNIFYDVNQKIRCVYYLLLALYLAAPQMVRLWELVVLQRVAVPVKEPLVSGPRGVRVAASLVPMLFAVVLAVHFVPSDWYRYHSNLRKDAMRGPNYGVWRVDSFAVGDETKPLLSDGLRGEMGLKAGEDRWRQVILDAGGQVYLLLGNNEYDFVDGKEDARTGELVLTDSGDAAWQARLHLVRTSGDGMTGEGEVNGNPVKIMFTKVDVGQSHLMDAPHWISEGRRW